MHLKEISLKSFRNISSLALELHPRFNIFIGANAQGKTNILEAIYLLAFGKSFRVQDYRDLIQSGQGEAFVRAWATLVLGEEEREAHLSAEKKKIFKNGKAANPNQFQSMPTVLFAPEEILLLKDSPHARRDYVDGLLSKLSPTYEEPLKQYKRALAQRNKLLKDKNISKDEKLQQMILWERPLFENGKILIQERIDWSKRLNENLRVQYRTIANDGKEALFFYSAQVKTEEFTALQEQRREEEIERETTLVGPHRDDFIARLNDQPIRVFGSQGEMRTFTLAMKLSEIRLFEEVLGEAPLLLLDDVLSELDEKRNAYFFSYLQNFKGQVFATATSLNLFPPLSLKEFFTFKIESGSVKAS